MAYNVTTDATIANFQADLSDLVEILNRGGYPASLLAPTTLTALTKLCNPANGTTQIALS